MFSRQAPKDNSNKQIKFLLRQALLPRIEPKVALDLFAGRGEITGRLYQGFREIHCVEKNPRSFSFLQQRFAPTLGARVTSPAQCAQAAQPLIHLHRADNLKFISEKVAGIAGINLVDFDAYGSPNPQVKAFFQHYRASEPMLIFATDGGKLARLRGRLWHPDWYSAREPEGPSAPRYNHTVTQNYELLIRQFWREMARAHAFRLQTFELVWKRGKLVAYYGILIESV